MIDSSNFTGPGAVFALVLAHVREDFWSVDDTSTAYRTARKFIEGGTCEHVLCDKCNHPGESGWGRRLCDQAGPWVTAYGTLQFCKACNHSLERHHVYEFDWTDHRNLLIEALGIDAEGLVSLIRAGR